MVEQLSPADAQARVASGALLLDVREQSEWDAAHISGALHVPLGDLAARLEELDPERPIVIVCRSGGRSDAAANALERTGRFSAANLAGGMIAWIEQGLAIEPVDGSVR